MDRGVSMPNMLEPKASIFFFLYNITICTERSFKIYTMFIYLSAFFSWKEEHVLRVLVLAHWLKGNPRSSWNTPLSAGKLVERTGSFLNSKDSHQLVSWLSMPLQELLSHSGAFSMLAHPCSSAHSFHLKWLDTVCAIQWRIQVSSKQLISLYPT